MRGFRQLQMTVAAVLLVSSAATGADMAKVEAFGYAPVNRPGTFETMSSIGATQVSPSTLADLKTIAPSVTTIELYCAASPGPRFMQIDGKFYTLNGKSRRPGAFVETSRGKLPVQDTNEGRSPLGDDYRVLGLLVEEAAGACR